MKNVILVYILLIVPVLTYSQNDKAIGWYDIEEAVKLNVQAPKKIFVYVYTDNCGWCTRMTSTTFKNPVIIKYLNGEYYPVRLDANIRKDIILGDRTFKFVAANPSERIPAYHELVVTILNGRLAYPAYAFLDEKLTYIGVELGYKSPEMMEKWLYFIANDIYKKNPSFDEFALEFKGELEQGINP